MSATSVEVATKKTLSSVRCYTEIESRGDCIGAHMTWDVFQANNKKKPNEKFSIRIWSDLWSDFFQWNIWAAILRIASGWRVPIRKSLNANVHDSNIISSHPWETVAQAAWRKYPNPMNTAVIGTDVVERNVIDGVLHTHRLVSSQWYFPSWVHRVS